MRNDCSVCVTLNHQELGEFESMESARAHIARVYEDCPEMTDGIMGILLLRDADKNGSGFWKDEIRIFRNGMAEFTSSWVYYRDTEIWMEDM